MRRTIDGARFREVLPYPQLAFYALSHGKRLHAVQVEAWRVAA